jgi:hypothetical protein
MPRRDDRFLDKLLVRKAPPKITDRVLELWREYQTALQRHGVTDYTRGLCLGIWQEMRLAPGVDTLPEEEIHRLAYDNPLPPHLSW